jgi:hypothetical protein
MDAVHAGRDDVTYTAAAIFFVMLCAGLGLAGRRSNSLAFVLAAAMVSVQLALLLAR